MTVASLRALDVFPCGGCRALVPSTDGCEHYVPSATPARVTKRARENRARFDRAFGIMRIAESTRARSVLERAVGAGSVRFVERVDRQTANKLTRAGLLSLGKRGGPHTITPAGRDVWRKILEL